MAKKAAKVETKRLKNEKRLDLKYESLPLRKNCGISEEEYIQEMSQGLPLPDTPGETHNRENETEYYDPENVIFYFVIFLCLSRQVKKYYDFVAL